MIQSMPVIIFHWLMTWKWLYKGGTVASICLPWPIGDGVRLLNWQAGTVVHVSADSGNAIGGWDGFFEYVSTTWEHTHMWHARKYIYTWGFLLGTGLLAEVEYSRACACHCTGHNTPRMRIGFSAGHITRKGRREESKRTTRKVMWERHEKRWGEWPR